MSADRIANPCKNVLCVVAYSLRRWAVGCDMFCSKTRGTLRTALFWVITQRVVVIPYRRFNPETSVKNCHYSLRNNPEEHSSHLQRYVLEEERTDVAWEEVSAEETPWRRLEVDGTIGLS